MATVSVKAGTYICKTGAPISNIYVIADGNITLELSTGNIALKKGDVIGIEDIVTGVYSVPCRAVSDAVLIVYPYSGLSQFLEFIDSSTEVKHIICTAMMRQTALTLRNYFSVADYSVKIFNLFSNSYKDYHKLCKQYAVSAKTLPELEEASSLDTEELLPRWTMDYYEGLATLPKEIKASLYPYSKIISGELLIACDTFRNAINSVSNLSDYLSELAPILLNENEIDLVSYYLQLFSKAASKGADRDYFTKKIDSLFEVASRFPGMNKELIERRRLSYKELLTSGELFDSAEASSNVNISSLDDSLESILQYAGVDDETAQSTRAAMEDYLAMSDKNDGSDDGRKVRLKLTKAFYKIYEACFLKSLEGQDIPVTVALLLNFGYMDERLVSEETAAYLLTIIPSYAGSPKRGLYTLPEWLTSIYLGYKEPSKNEFDLDYPAYLRDERLNARITAAEEKELLTSQIHKVKFELNNLFPTVNKIVFGRISTFCPVFSEHNILKSLSSVRVDINAVTKSFNYIRSFDYSAFFREGLFSDDSIGVPKEFVISDILPDVLLMPAVGIRGSMWQEIEGKVRKTHARMVLPTFLLEDITQVLIRLTGEFRWEMCKRIQGARWNDLAEPSLTALYCDYIQFYKKNRELSNDAKEKIKATLAKSKNSNKEMFVRDYLDWINYEGNGAPRLNKVAREILFAYCPFSKDIREKLASNPQYTLILNTFRSKQNQKIHHFEMVADKIRKNGKEVPEAIEMQLEMLKM